ncbi:MAG TPA: prepilin-type N-terminal cleavage/methylation domain-containing protein, partial [Polyangiaceae bacterium]|nr:prepilin-type N-terminal cleavage/methylation domain-containing protein [Polyangiaceae bacterium]
RGPARPPAAPSRAARAARRGLTLLEVLIVVTLAGLLSGAVVMGMGSATNAKLKAASTLVSSAIRGAYARSAATSRPVRVVFDFDQQRVWLEEGTGRMLARTADPLATGGADPATAAEQAAAAQADTILKGPRAPRPTFRPVRQLGLEDDAASAAAAAKLAAATASQMGAPPPLPTAAGTAPPPPASYGRALGAGIRFREVHSTHQAAPARAGRAYLYVWPGGQTETAYVQIAKGTAPTDADTLTLVVHPLTGRVRMLSGAKTVAMPRSPEEATERAEPGGF